MPGMGSCWMKLRTNSSASDTDVCSSFDEASCSKSAPVGEPVAIQPVGEAEAGHAIGLGEERRQPLLDAALGHERAQRRRFRGSHEDAAAGVGGQERRTRLLRHLGEPRGEQAAEDPLDRHLSIRPMVV